jgi:general secretion pathway protein F
MPAFKYSALDSRGKTATGVLEGTSPRQVRQQLRKRGLVPTVIHEVVHDKVRDVSGTRIRRVGVTDLAMITRQLATLIRSGLPLEEALFAVSGQTPKANVKSLMLSVRSRVVEGQSLSTSLGSFPRAFPEVFRATVAAGEHSGHLHSVLEHLADYMERRQQMRQKTLLALFYPMMISAVAILVVGALLAYVVPEVVQVFEGVDQDLPWLTRTVIGVSDVIGTYWPVGALLVVALGMGQTFLRRNKTLQKRIDAALIKLPVISYVIRTLNTARFTRTLGVLVLNGVPLLDGLRITAQVLGNLPMREAVEGVAERVKEGADLHSALDNSGLFSPVTIHLVASGEMTGRLGEMLERAASSQEQELESIISAFMALIEPILILVMGGIVLVIVLAILMPIFELNQLIK